MSGNTDQRANGEGTQQKVQQFFEQFPQVSLQEADRLLSAGQEVRSIFYLESGVVQMVALTKLGDKNIVTLFKPGSFFPLIWGLTQKPNPYDFEALTEVKLRKAPAKQVAQFLQTNVDVTFSLALRLMSGLEGLSQKVQQATHGSSRTRLVQLLVTMVYRFGEPRAKAGEEKGAGEVVLPLHIRHAHLAEMSGLSRETVTRQMALLKKEKLISVQKRRYVVANLSRLEQLL